MTNRLSVAEVAAIPAGALVLIEHNGTSLARFLRPVAGEQGAYVRKFVRKTAKWAKGETYTASVVRLATAEEVATTEGR